MVQHQKAEVTFGEPGSRCGKAAAFAGGGSLKTRRTSLHRQGPGWHRARATVENGSAIHADVKLPGLLPAVVLNPERSERS